MRKRLAQILDLFRRRDKGTVAISFMLSLPILMLLVGILTQFALLANARLFGTTPWAALGELGREIGVEELSDLAAALTLAADDGAKIRQSLAARAATMRRRELADVEGEAGEKSQSMLVAQLVICAGFMVFLAYPAISQLVNQ